MDITIQDASFDSPDHRSFSAMVTAGGDWFDGRPFPFTYLCDGSDDAASPISEAVGAAYRTGSIEVGEYAPAVLSDESIASEVREQRDAQLDASDYFVQPDYPAKPESSAAVISYRQALRDITAQPGFPREVVWPEKPAILK